MFFILMVKGTTNQSDFMTSFYLLLQIHSIEFFMDDHNVKVHQFVIS